MMRIKIVSMADCWELLGLGGVRELLLIDVSDRLHGAFFLNSHLCVCVAFDILQMITEHHMTSFSALTLLLPPIVAS